MKSKITATIAVIATFVIVYAANPFGIFDSDEMKNFKKVMETSNQINAIKEELKSEKTVIEGEIEKNNREIKEIEDKLKENKGKICALEEQIGREEIDFSKTTCSSQN